ncbi:aldehyde-activating protein [Hwanghaeella grinnelliae]|uniref:Aldehyde-activating protein n=1 Tax=Hwanghaeella grinnelliae TaxID=2500179 RepID=A0A3S2VKP0_9PROT|nr:GFA family protein [Hwanghaeella grinnelliae]RVU34141.1 aldehyde-activating protein [Hwanghaeella grinnelliae]
MLEGSCLCGTVQYRTEAQPMITGHCYCIDCRKSSGTSHCTHVMVPQDGLTMTGDVKLYERPADSGNIVSRGFCPDCGSPVFSTNSAFAGMVILRASSLDNPDAVEPEMAVYASRAPGWAKIDETKPVFPEMPPGGPDRVIEERSE